MSTAASIYNGLNAILSGTASNAAGAAQDAAENETTMKRLLDIDIETEELDDREAAMEEAAYWNEFFWECESGR